MQFVLSTFDMVIVFVLSTSEPTCKVAGPVVVRGAATQPALQAAHVRPVTSGVSVEPLTRTLPVHITYSHAYTADA